MILEEHQAELAYHRVEAAVRERQTILRIPDLLQMQVKVNVHESKVDQIQPGM